MRKMLQVVSVLAFCCLSSARGQLAVKPQKPAATPLIREAFMPKGKDILLSYPMEARHNGKPVWYWKYHKRQLSDLVITNAKGDTLTEQQIVKALSKPTMLVLSSDGKPVHPYYLQVMKPETLVVIDKTPPPPKTDSPPVKLQFESGKSDE